MARSLPLLAYAAVLTFAALPHPSRAAAILFDFEDQAVDAQTPLTITSGGLSAAFAGPSAVDPGAFAVGFNISNGPFAAPYRTLTGAFLTVGPAFGATGSPLTITFSAPLSAISLLFALDDPAHATSLTLTTDAGGTTSSTGALSADFRYPEGTLAFSGAAFTTVTLSSSAIDFQVDDVRATLQATASVPEPASFAMLGAGLAAFIAQRRSRR
jgi:hypothetical protein